MNIEPMPNPYGPPAAGPAPSWDERTDVDHTEKMPGVPKQRRPLTDREKEILDLAARGYDFRDTATELAISTDTVKSHLKRIYIKLDARNKPHAVALAYQKGIIK